MEMKKGKMTSKEARRKGGTKGGTRVREVIEEGKRMQKRIKSKPPLTLQATRSKNFFFRFTALEVQV